jgi:argininosuccinate lyase
VHFDHRLWEHDIAGSIAHAHALAGAGVMDEKELSRMVEGLRGVARDISAGKLDLDPSLEDVHMNIEKFLTDRVPDLGTKLHTGRSRNDQVALDMRLYVRQMIVKMMTEASALQNVLLRKASESKGMVLPGYTHLQHAQPVLLAHHLLAHFWRLERDLGRLGDCYARTNTSPLGSGALAGTSFALDRHMVAKMLGMDGVTENSMDSVSDRDFVAETAFALSLLMIHLSSLCEEIIVWSSHEFGFVKLPKGLSGGSSMMPQKLNPDIAELVRGKSGRVVGHLIAILTLLKSLPLAYNRDLQEDKENLFDVFDTVGASLHALKTLLAGIEFDGARMRRAAEAGLMTATDLADLLAKGGVPFRQAHGIVRELAIKSKGDDRVFADLAEQALGKKTKGGHGVDKGFFEANKAVTRRNTEGGTAPEAVRSQMRKARACLVDTNVRISKMSQQCAKSRALVSG